jgi:tetratricopeptide (TPR) repeat protein
MRRLLWALVTFVAFGGTAWADDWADCAQSSVYPDRAIRSCSNIITAGRESGGHLAIAYYNRGDAYAAKGDLDRAIADENKAIELNPQLAAAYSDRGFAYGNKRAYDREIADETQAIELNPQLAAAYVNRGAAYANKGDYDLSIADETKAIELNPQLANAYVGRGAAYASKGNYDQGIADETKAIEFNPDSGLAYYDRGLAYAMKGDPTDAANDFRAAAQLTPASDKWHSEALARIADLEKQLVAAAPAPVPPVQAGSTCAFAGGRLWADRQGRCSRECC